MLKSLMMRCNTCLRDHNYRYMMLMWDMLVVLVICYIWHMGQRSNLLNHSPPMTKDKGVELQNKLLGLGGRCYLISLWQPSPNTFIRWHMVFLWISYLDWMTYVVDAKCVCLGCMSIPGYLASIAPEWTVYEINQDI